jgi:hypothetical protein
MNFIRIVLVLVLVIVLDSDRPFEDDYDKTKPARPGCFQIGPMKSVVSIPQNRRSGAPPDERLKSLAYRALATVVA